MRDSDAVEREALTAFEELADRYGDALFRHRLLSGLPAEVRARIEALEASVDRAAQALPTLIPGSAISDADLAPPERVGAFRLRERLGRGGMGDVWLGERADGLFEQRVAVKLIQRHALARAGAAFDAERRFLARLEHADIARLVDGGVTEDGLPWLATEYVEGRTIDEAVAGWTIEQRVALFARAARAVQFVHGQLVAHGDVKPANIVVATDGRLKLLDFGISALIDGEAPGPAAPLTASFASPERLQSGQPSVADDIYALGRTLAMLIGDEPGAELEAIVARATAAPDLRYGSAEALATDLDRWRAHWPVAAMPDRTGYRMRKFVARHRHGVLATALAVLTIALLGITAAVSYGRAERARSIAATRFADAHHAAHYLMFDVIDQLEHRPGTLALRTRIATLAQGYFDRLARSPDAPPDVKLDMAVGYLRLAALAGIGQSPNYADYVRAHRDLDQARAILDQLRRQGFLRDLAPPFALAAEYDCQSKIYGTHDVTQALRAARRGLAQLATIPAPASIASNRAALRVCEADALVWLERPNEAIAILQSELAAARARNLASDEVTTVRLLRILGEAFYYAKRFGDAERVLTEALDRLGRQHAREPYYQATVNQYASVSDDLASTYEEQGRYAEELVVATRARDLVQAQVALDPADLQSQRRWLSISRLVGTSLAHTGRQAEAIALMDDVQRRWDALVRRFPADSWLARVHIMSMRVRADMRRDAGRRQEACAIYREAGAAWISFGRRWHLSPSDEVEEVSPVRKGVAACGSPAQKG